MSKKLVILFCIVVATMLGLAAYHRASMNRMAEQPLPLAHWEDRSGQATIQEVRQIRSFAPVLKRRISLGYTESIHWFRFTIRADSIPREFSFDVRNHTIDGVELFGVSNGTAVSLGKTGSRFPFAQRPSPTKTFVYLLTVDPGQQIDYYLRLDKRYESLTTELILWRTDDFENKEQREYFLWGIFSGIVCLVVLLAFLFYRSTHDPVYGWYGLYILGLALRQFADTGLGFQYLWPDFPTLNHPDAVIWALWLYLPAMFQFQQYFLQLKTESPPVFWATQVCKYLFWGLFAGLTICQLTNFTETYTGSYRLMVRLHQVMANGSFLVFGAVIVVGFRASDTVKRLYAVGLAIQIFGQLFVVVQNTMQSKPDGIFFIDTYLVLMINFFIDLLIFAYLLAYRYRKFTDEQRRLQISLAQTRQQTNNAIIDVLESERQQVGNLLLTDVSGRLTSARHMLSALAPSPLLADAMTLIEKTDHSLDQILRDNLPPDLNTKGLSTALSELVEQRTQTGTTRLQFQHDERQSYLSATASQHLYRIANELITNILKHAKATEGQVELRYTQAGWQLTVADNGQGFDPSSSRQADGIGLKNLRARAQTLDATISLDSGPNGTTVRVLVPEKIQTS